MTIYEVTNKDGSVWHMQANLAEASAPLRASFDGDEWASSPFQTANASHNKFSAAELLNDYFETEGTPSPVDTVVAVDDDEKPTITYDDAKQFVLGAPHDEMIRAIKNIYNCREIEIDDEGDIWIASPQRGHWLNNDDLIDLVARVQRGA